MWRSWNIMPAPCLILGWPIIRETISEIGKNQHHSCPSVECQALVDEIVSGACQAGGDELIPSSAPFTFSKELFGQSAGPPPPLWRQG